MIKKTQHVETFTLNGSDYASISEPWVICGKGVELVLGNLPLTIKVTISRKRFTKARSLWIHRGNYLGGRGVWTWLKRQNPNTFCETNSIHNGFYSAAINRLNMLVSNAVWLKTDPQHPLRLFFRIEAVSE